MIKRIILSTLVLLMVSSFSISAAGTEPLAPQSITAAANNVLATKARTGAPIVSASISNGKVIVELPPELAEEQTITVNVGMDDITDDGVSIGIGSFHGEFFGMGYGFFAPGWVKSGTLEFVNNTGETYKITDYAYSSGWAEDIGRIYNEAAIDAGYDVDKTKALDDEAWYQLNYEYFNLEENAHNFDTLIRMFGNGKSGQGIRIAKENHPTMNELAFYHLFSNTQFTFDQINYPINISSSRPNTPNISVLDYIQKTEQNESLVNSIFSSQEIGEEGLVLNIAAQTEDYGIGNAYNKASADYGFTLTLTRVTPNIGPIPHTVSYDANGATSGEVPIDSGNYYEGEAVTVKGNEGSLGKPGYVFVGWTTAADGSGTVFYGGDVFTMGTADVSLYAKWNSVDGGNTIPTSEHEAYVIGYPDETFRADNNITRGEASLIFYRLLDDENKNANVGKKFSDVNDEWYARAVNYLAHIGIVEGYEDNSFRPDSPAITRAEFAAIISRLNNLDEARVNVFSDVSDEHWAAGYIGGVAQKGWIIGFSDGTFRPDEGITRAQAVVLVNNVMGRKLRREDIPADILRLYSDTTPEHWAFADIMEASVKHAYFKDAEGFEMWQNYSK